MAKFIRRFAVRRKPKTYEEQRTDAESSHEKKRLTLAKDSETSREILYYLAENDPSVKVRQAVVQNESLPLQAAPLLAKDSSEDVRMSLAARLVNLLPDISSTKHSQLYAFVVQALGDLALDEVLKIRRALSSTLKDHAYAPPKVAGQLARDVEREVSEPILRFCAALSDDDLIDILKAHPDSWVVCAVAKRKEISEEVSEAVIETEDEAGGEALIDNEGAHIAPGLLMHIVKHAKDFPTWQKPIALRKGLPLSVAKDLAMFVDESIRDLLLDRWDFNADETEEIAAVFRRRMDFSEGHADGEEEGVAAAQARLKKLLARGALTESHIADALGMREYYFVYAALAYLSKVDVEVVKKVFASKTAKPIVALSWKAGLSMRMAFQLQKELGHVPPKALLYPKAGTDYPLTEEEIKEQLASLQG